jgi:hypothetical protein
METLLAATPSGVFRLRQYDDRINAHVAGLNQFAPREFGMARLREPGAPIYGTKNEKWARIPKAVKEKPNEKRRPKQMEQRNEKQNDNIILKQMEQMIEKLTFMGARTVQCSTHALQNTYSAVHHTCNAGPHMQCSAVQHSAMHHTCSATHIQCSTLVLQHSAVQHTAPQDGLQGRLPKLCKEGDGECAEEAAE